MPEWYYLPFYAILRSIPNKLLGVVALFSAIVVLAFVPWLDTSKVRSATYRPLYKQFFWIFVVVCVGLGWLGSKPPEGVYVVLARIFTAWYFIHFLIILPLLGRLEKPRPLPNSISEAVLKKRSLATATAVLLAATVSIGGLLGTATRASAEEVRSRRVRTGRSRDRFSASMTRRNCSAGSRSIVRSCQTCHSLKLVPFQALGWEGGPAFNEAQVKGNRRGVQGQGRAQRAGRGRGASGASGGLLPAAIPE